MKYHFRRQENKDLDMLYGNSEARKWLIPYCRSKEINVSVSRNLANIAISEDKSIMFFMFPENYSINDKGNWFVYFDVNYGLLIIQDRIDFIVFYCSPALELLREQVQSKYC